VASTRSFAAALALAFFISHSAPVAAADPVCKPRKLRGSDLESLRRTAREVAAGRKLDWSSSRPCSRKGHFSTIIKAIPVPHPDGTELYGSVWCERDYEPWECRWAQFRILNVQVRTPGGPRQVMLRLEGNVDASLMAEISQHAVDVGPKLQLQQECYPGEAAGLNSGDATSALEALRKDLAFGDPEPFARIDDYNVVYALEVNNRYLEYRVQDGGPGLEFKCWGAQRWLRLH
jgi:hypothetical protein